MSNRKLLLKSREKAGIRSSTQTLKEDIRLFAHAVPQGFLEMDEADFWRHLNKLYQTNYVLTCLLLNQYRCDGLLSAAQIEAVRGFDPKFGC